jgi:hypothetical protein
MVLTSKVFKVALATAFGLIMGVGAQIESEAAGYQHLCMSKPSQCDYAPRTAPVLAANVCYSSLTGLVVLKGSGSCALGSYPFFVEHGEVVNPVTNEVQAYIALADACSMGFCVANNPSDPPGEEGAMCCDASNGCGLSDGICPPEKVAVWCPDGQEAAQSNGEWICQESA